jgi:regulator of replication initiation timing
MAVANQLSKVIDKTGRLIELCTALQEENDLLKQENDQLKHKVDLHSQLKIDLEEKLRVLTLARSLEGIQATDLGLNEKTFDIKQKITDFVREIDKCIVLLKK